MRPASGRLADRRGLSRNEQTDAVTAVPVPTRHSTARPARRREESGPAFRAHHAVMSFACSPEQSELIRATVLL